MDKTTDKNKRSAKQRLGSIASMFGGLLGDAVDSSKGMKKRF